jgi:DNA polymerase elongation subunit (family B)
MDIYIVDWDDKQNRRNEPYTMLIYGICGTNNESCVCRIIKYRPTFSILVNHDTDIVAMTRSLRRECKLTFDYDVTPAVKSLVMFSCNSMVRVAFKFDSINDMSTLRNFITSAWSIQTYEANIRPFNKYIHNRKINAAGWITLERYEVLPSKSTFAKIEILAEFDAVIPCARIDIPKLSTLAFDIETDSAHGEFSVAKKDYTALVKYVFIMCRLMKRKIPGTRFADSSYISDVRPIRERIYAAIYDSFYGDDPKHIIYLKPGYNPPTQYEIESIIPAFEHYYSANDFDSALNLCNRKFPCVAGDHVVKIGSAFKRFGDAHPYLISIVSLGDCSAISLRDVVEAEFGGMQIPQDQLKGLLKRPIIDYTRDHAEYIASRIEKQYAEMLPYSKVEVISCETEREVLLRWTLIIQRENPNIVTGYNTFGFDYKFLYTRAEQLGVVESFAQLGMHIGLESPLIEDTSDKRSQEDGILSDAEKRKADDRKSLYISATGRVTFDLLKYMRKTQPHDSYKLDAMTEYYLNQHKVDMPIEHMFQLQKGTSDDRRLVSLYCMIDCVLCIRLMDKLDFLINNIEMAKVCFVPLKDIFLRGQSVKILSLVSSVCDEHNFVVPDREINNESCDDSYEGAIVLEPMSGTYTTPIAVGDFTSLYPSIMISENISLDTIIGWRKLEPLTKGSVSRSAEDAAKLPTNILDNNGIDGPMDNLPGYEYNDIYYYEYIYQRKINKKTGSPGEGVEKILSGNIIHCRFVVSMMVDGTSTPIVGILVMILKMLLEMRASTRAKQKEYPYGSFEYGLLEGKQLAYKITANSLYGQLGASKGSIYLKELAACVTATGRKLIMFSRNYILTTYPGSEVIYGDTDSIFIKFDMRKELAISMMTAINKSITTCIEATTAISKQLKKPHKLAFEKVICPFVLQKKKKYVGDYYTKIDGKPEFKYMGNVLKRRDSCKITKSVYNECIMNIMKSVPMTVTLAAIKARLRSIMNGEVPLDQFILSRKWNGGMYKNPAGMAHHQLAERMIERDPGNAPTAGDRILYAFYCNPAIAAMSDADKKKAKQSMRIESIGFIQKNNLKLDYEYYIWHQILKPLTELVVLGNHEYDNMSLNAAMVHIFGKFMESVKRMDDEATIFVTTPVAVPTLRELMAAKKMKLIITEL